MKINIRESLNRLDLQTDNKYDLRNTYDCSKISDNKKKELAEALNKNASAKEVSKLLSEDYDDYDDKYDAKYVANSYYGRDYSGLEDYIYTDDYSELEDWVWEKIINGGYVEVFNRDSGKSVRLDPDKYDRESDDIYGILDDLRSVNESLNENNHEQLFKVVIQSGATKRDFESALYEDEAEEIVDYYGGRWIDENGFEWDMYVEEDDDSTEHTMIDNSYDMEDDDERAQRECVESLNESSDFAIDTFNSFSPEYAKLSAICILLNSMSPNKINYRVEDTYFDYGQDWKWTTIIAHRNNGDSWQAIYPAMQERILLAGDFDATNTAEFVNDPEFEEIAKDILRESRLDKGFNENLKEADYGGAYDIENDMFFTKEDIVEFAEEVCEYLGDIFSYQYDINNVYMDGPRKLYINIYDNNYIEVESTFDIDMRKIRKPSDLFKVYGLTIENWFQKAFAREYRDAGLDESLKETLKLDNDQKNKLIKTIIGAEENELKEIVNDVYFFDRALYLKLRHFIKKGSFKDKKDYLIKVLQNSLEEPLKEAIDDEIDFDYETDFGDGSVEEGDTFIEDGREWSWIERIAGPIHLDFDNWAVWSARDWDYIQEKIRPILLNKEELTVETLTKIYDEAEVAYFVVDEDTGFIDWGPVESQTEAQDFLNGKVEDYENDEEYEEVEVEEESLKESINQNDIFKFLDEIKDTVSSFKNRVQEVSEYFNISKEEAEDFVYDWEQEGSLTESKAIKNNDDFEVTLHYDDIGNGKEYDYKLGYDEVVDYLREIAWSNGDGPEDLNEDEYLEWVMDNFDELANKYELNVLDYFEDEASQHEYDHRYDEP